MTGTQSPRTVVHLLLLVLLVSTRGARADSFEPFEVTNIRIEGLQRITEGAVFNQLPVNIGDRLDARRVREALRAVIATGFFKDVEFRQEEGGVLLLVVQERPTIKSFEVKGNKDIKTEDLVKSLRTIGLATGKILNRSALEDTRQYFPPYDAVPIVRADTLARRPEVGRALARLAGRITAQDMRAMNRAVDVDRQSPRDVAARFVRALPTK